MSKKPTYVHDGPFVMKSGGAVGDHYVRVWRSGRGRYGETIVQVWLNTPSPEGEPDGDWSMPRLLVINDAIEMAILQTKPRRPARTEAPS